MELHDVPLFMFLSVAAVALFSFVAVAEGMKLGGLITAASGIGIMIFFRAMEDPNAKAVFLVGAIPLLIGLALMAYAYLLAPKEKEN